MASSENSLQPEGPVKFRIDAFIDKAANPDYELRENLSTENGRRLKYALFKGGKFVAGISEETHGKYARYIDPLIAQATKASPPESTLQHEGSWIRRNAGLPVFLGALIFQAVMIGFGLLAITKYFAVYTIGTVVAAYFIDLIDRQPNRYLVPLVTVWVLGIFVVFLAMLSDFPI